MKIDLSIITKSINKELTQEADISLTSFRSRLGDFPIVRKAPVTLQIRNEENAAVFVKGTVDIDVMIPCARCLEEVRTPIRFDIDKKLTVREEGLVDEEILRVRLPWRGTGGGSSQEFAESFQERNPHLRVFNMVLHMDEATPHLHVDFVPVATEQSRGLSTRVSMKQALKQQGFEGLGRKQTEWKAWMEREKEALTEIAQAHEFEIISLGGGRPHMELPEYRAAAQRLEAVQEQVIAAEQEIAALEKQRKALQGNVKLLKAVEKVKPDLDAIQPEKTLTGAVKGVTVEQVKELKAAVIRGAAAEQKVRELKVENQQLQQKIPSMKEKLKEAQERQRLENENRQLKVQVEYLEKDLSWERGISARLQEGIGAVLDFLDQHLPEQFRPLVEKARELLPVPEVQQPEREQERGHTWGGMEL